MKKYTVVVLFFIIIQNLIAKPSDKVKFDSDEMTELEYNFFTKIDNSETNNLEIYYNGFIIASGITDSYEFEIYKQKLNDIRKKAKEDLSQYLDEGAFNFGKRLLLWIYDRGILKKYFENATLFQDMIYKGEYNCLTSSILYALLYKEFGFDVYGVLTSNHSFCVAITERGEIDVETTLARGFNPGTKEIRNTGTSTIVTFVPKQNYNNRRPVDILTLIATLYPNSISLRNVEKDLAKQITMAKKAYYLSPNTDLYNDNLVNAYNRAALDAMKKNDYKSSYEYLKEAFNFDPENKITKNNRIHYFNTIGAMYLKDKDFTNAIQIYKLAIKEIGNSETEVLKKNLKVSYYNYAVTEYNSRRYNNAYNILEEALNSFPNDKDLLRLQTSIPR